MLWSSSSYGLPIDVRCTTEHICTSDRITRVGYFIWIYVLCTTSNYAIIKAKSAPQLELYVMPLFLERAVAAKRTRIRSAPQNAVLSRAAQGSQTQGFQNHIPARGRKLSVKDGINNNSVISKPHPRKGTETIRQRRNQQQLCNFKTTSPQGDGNLHDYLSKIYDQTISKPHPRKGTETPYG